MKPHEYYYELYNGNRDVDFTEPELKFLRNYKPIKDIIVKYIFYNGVSSSGKYIGVVFDLSPNQTRRGGVENKWKVIAERSITPKEIDEFILFHFQKSYKRFFVFYYKDLEKLLIDDCKLNAETPYNYIKECEKRGYTGKYQTKIEF